MPNPLGAAGLAVVNITSEPQQLPGGGVTVVNEGTMSVILSTDSNVTSSNSWTLAVNGAYPIPANSGPIWASVSTGSGQVVVLGAEYNIVNPLVNTNVVNATTITTAQVGVASGSADSFSIPAGIYSFISWGYFVGSVGASPSKGTALLEVIALGTPAYSFLDTITAQESSSDIMDGIVFPLGGSGGGTAAITNFLDQGVTFFLNYAIT